jgi:3-oxoacyl-[acyl-carrier-protein] synthase III
MRNQGPKRAHRPPSRVRYDRDHPVLGTRVARADYDAVKEFLAKNRWTLAKFMRVVVRQEQEKYAEAFRRGYEKARDRYSVTYSCGKCGGAIVVESQGEKDAAAVAFESEGWAHSKCPE